MDSLNKLQATMDALDTFSSKNTLMLPGEDERDTLNPYRFVVAPLPTYCLSYPGVTLSIDGKGAPDPGITLGLSAADARRFAEFILSKLPPPNAPTNSAP